MIDIIMSQVAIREYDAKQLFAHYTSTVYHSHLIDTTKNNRSDDFLSSELAQSGKLLVVKPDMLFGKRGKHGLVGVKFTPEQVVTWVREKSFSPCTIDHKTAVLDIFIVEEFVPHTQEYYIAFKTQRECDVMYFSLQGGMDVEQERDAHIQEYKIPLLENSLAEYLQTLELSPSLQSHCIALYRFFCERGCSYLEVNPFCSDANGIIHNLDMVVKVDDCEGFKHDDRKRITWTKAFGEISYPAERVVKALDEKTGASLKLSIINPQGDIWLLLGGGGASVITMDTLSNHGLLDRVANYGELSGNPDYDNNKAYISQILQMMAKHPKPQQYLCMIGGIANFTRIDYLCQAFVNVLEESLDLVKSNNIHIICRRGGVNDTQGLALVEKFCTAHDIPCQIFDGSTYLTEWVKVIS